MKVQQAQRRVTERPDDSAAEAFLAATAGAVIDYVTFDHSGSETLPTGIAGFLKLHDRGASFTVHDPTPGDLLALADRKLIRVEVSIDLRPYRILTSLERARQLALIHQFVASRLWPFDAQGIYPAYRVSPAPGKGYEPRNLDDHGDAEGLRLPRIDESLYLGDRYDYTRPGSNVPSWAQVRLYLKLMDQGQHLPEEQYRVRTEVTIAQKGLAVMKIGSTADLLGFNYRQLSDYFRLLRPAPVTLKPHPNERRIARKDKVASPFIRAIRRRAREHLCQLALDEAIHAGMMSLMINHAYGQRVVLGAAHRDAVANRKMSTALDNLTKKLSSL